MRTLKKTLALVLVVAMMMSLCITSNAAFTDADEIEYVEAVEVLTAIGVIDGFPAGDFQPQGSLTRAQAAKILVYILGEEAYAKADGQIFDDVAPNHWAADYIAYCAENGLVDGYGDGKFGPEDKLTGYQWAKMLMAALGIDTSAMIGAAWQIPVAKAAAEIGLFAGNNAADKTAICTREEACLYALNVLNIGTASKGFPLYKTVLDAEGEAVTAAIAYYATVTEAAHAAEALNKSDDEAEYSIGYKKVAYNASSMLSDIHGVIRDVNYNDIWGRPGTLYVNGNYSIYLVYMEDYVARYLSAVSDCQLASDLGMTKYDDSTVAYWNDGDETTTEIDLYDVLKTNGAQGTLIEVYADRIVEIETYLAKVGAYHKAVVDLGGHVKTPAYCDIEVYDAAGCCTVLETVTADTSYAKGEMVLVNVNAVYGVIPVQAAESVIGAQTAHFINSAKHEIEDVVYDDAAHFHLDPAGTQSGDWTWYLDQYGNLIGDAKIVTPSQYGVIKSIQWINPEDENGYAKATIVDMNGEATTMKIASIDGYTVKYIFGDAGIDNNNDIAYVSDDLADNYAVYAAQHLYEITAGKGGMTLTHVATYDKNGDVDYYNHIEEADVETGIPSINGVLVDNDTQYLIRVKTLTPHVYTFETAVGYENVADYTGSDVDVDYVDIDGDTIADYVYIIGTKDSAVAHDLVYITSAANIKAVLSKIGGDDYYVITGVIRGDGTTDPLYVKASAVDNRADLVAWVEDSVGKLFAIESIDGKVADMDDAIEVVSTEYADGKYARYCGAVTVIGSGMIDTALFGEFNTNSATVYVNKNGVMEASELKVGDFIYVIGKAVGSNYVYYAEYIFVTNNDVVGTTLANEKVEAAAELAAYAADVIDNAAWGEAANLTAAELAAVVNGAVDYTAINAADDVADVADALAAAKNAVWAAVVEAQAEAKEQDDEAAAEAALWEDLYAADGETVIGKYHTEDDLIVVNDDVTLGDLHSALCSRRGAVEAVFTNVDANGVETVVTYTGTANANALVNSLLEQGAVITVVNNNNDSFEVVAE